MKILFLDDEWVSMRHHVNALRAAGHDVEVRSNVDRVIDDAAQWVGLNGAILDVMMPVPPNIAPEGVEVGVAGIFVAKCLREHYPELPIIFLTNTREPAAQKEINAMANAAYADKRELSIKGLVALVQRHFGRRGD